MHELRRFFIGDPPLEIEINAPEGLELTTCTRVR